MDLDGLTASNSKRPNETVEPSATDAASDPSGAGEGGLGNKIQGDGRQPDSVGPFWTDLDIRQPATRLTLHFHGLQETDELMIHGGKIPLPFGPNQKELFLIYFPEAQAFWLQVPNENNRFPEMPRGRIGGCWLLTETVNGFCVAEANHAEISAEMAELFAKSLKLRIRELDTIDQERRAALWMTKRKGDGRPVLVSEGVANTTLVSAQNNLESSISSLYRQRNKTLDTRPLRDRILATAEDFEFGVSGKEEQEFDLTEPTASPGKTTEGAHAQQGEVVPIGGLKRGPQEPAQGHAGLSASDLLSREGEPDEQQLESEQRAIPANDEEDSTEEPREPSPPPVPDKVGTMGFSEALRLAGEAGDMKAHSLAKALSAYEIIRKSEK